jgi:hypothetical protein
MHLAHNTAPALVLDLHERPTARPRAERGSETRLRVAGNTSTSRFQEDERRNAEVLSEPPPRRLPMVSASVLAVGAAAPREPEPEPEASTTETDETAPVSSAAQTSRPVPRPGAIPSVVIALSELKDSRHLSPSAIYLLLCLDGAPSLEWAIDASALSPGDAYAALDDLMEHGLVRLT